MKDEGESVNAQRCRSPEGLPQALALAFDVETRYIASGKRKCEGAKCKKKINTERFHPCCLHPSSFCE